MKTQHVSALLYPGDLHDVWIGHCLCLDIVTQSAPGGGPAGALDSLVDAVALVVEHEGWNAFKRHEKAPQEFWSRLAIAPRPEGLEELVGRNAYRTRLDVSDRSALLLIIEEDNLFHVETVRADRIS